MTAFCLLACLAIDPPKLAIDTYTLENGLKVCLHRDPSAPRVAVVVAYHVGSKNERPGRTGFAHFFEHMMFRGTPQQPNYDLPFQEAGVQTNAFTSNDLTVYHETVPSEYLERALYMEANRMAFLPEGLDQKKFDTEREVVKNERRQTYENQPYGLAEEAIAANLWPTGHPYSWSVIGSMKDLDAAKVDDLRRFFAEHYHPGNAALCLAGDFSTEQAKAWIAKYFGPLAKGGAKRPVTPPAAAPAAKQVKMRDQVTFPQVRLAWQTPGINTADSAALEVLAEILSGGEAARLDTQLVREARLLQDVSCGQNALEIGGQFEIVALAAEGKQPAEVVAGIDAEIAKLKAAPPTDQEMARLRAKFETASYGRMASLLGRATMLAESHVRANNPEEYREEFAKFLGATPADVQRVAKQYLTAERLTLQILPLEPNGKQTPAFLAGPTGEADQGAPAEARKPSGDLDWKLMPAPTGGSPFQPPEIAVRKLKNGASAWIVSRRTLPLVTVRVLLPSGSADDPAGKGGLAGLCGTMLTQGTAKRNATELAEAFELLGASNAVAVGSETTAVTLGLISRNLQPALELVGEMLTQPRHEDADFQREKELLLAGLQQGPEETGWLAGRAFRKLMHGGDHPLGRPLDGTMTTVKTIALADVKEHHRRRYTSADAKVIVVGDIDPDQAVAALDAGLAAWNRPANPRPQWPASQPAKAPGVVHLVDKPGAVQTTLRIGRLWKRRDDAGHLAAQLGNRALGADFLSRLNQNLREKNGFTYGAGSAFRFYSDRSVWEVQTDVRADATGKALRQALDELAGAAGPKPLAGGELEVNRAGLARSFPEQFETIGGVANALLDIVEFGLPPDDWNTHLPRLQALPPADIAKTLAEMAAPEQQLILVVGDRKTIEPLLKDAGFKDLRVLTEAP